MLQFFEKMQHLKFLKFCNKLVEVILSYEKSESRFESRFEKPGSVFYNHANYENIRKPVNSEMHKLWYTEKI